MYDFTPTPAQVPVIDPNVLEYSNSFDRGWGKSASLLMLWLHITKIKRNTYSLMTVVNYTEIYKFTEFIQSHEPTALYVQSKHGILLDGSWLFFTTPQDTTKYAYAIELDYLAIEHPRYFKHRDLDLLRCRLRGLGYYRSLS